MSDPIRCWRWHEGSRTTAPSVRLIRDVIDGSGLGANGYTWERAQRIEDGHPDAALAGTQRCRAANRTTAPVRTVADLGDSEGGEDEQESENRNRGVARKRGDCRPILVHCRPKAKHGLVRVPGRNANHRAILLARGRGSASSCSTSPLQPSCCCLVSLRLLLGAIFGKVPRSRARRERIAEMTAAHWFRLVASRPFGRQTTAADFVRGWRG